MTNYIKYHQLEKYLLGPVGKKFRATGKISKEDFYLIIIWKSNRSKSITYKRLIKISPFNHVGKISKAIHIAKSNKEKMRILIEGWGFSLPIASAILTILYPRRFTIYDIRVLNSLKNSPKITSTVFCKQWEQYKNYMEEVKNIVPRKISLRNKDRWLWGKSLISDLKKDLRSGFPPKNAQ